MRKHTCVHSCPATRKCMHVKKHTKSNHRCVTPMTFCVPAQQLLNLYAQDRFMVHRNPQMPTMEADSFPTSTSTDRTCANLDTDHRYPKTGT